jgi:hypothetical protein
MGLQPNGIFDAFEMKKEVLKSKAKK